MSYNHCRTTCAQSLIDLKLKRLRRCFQMLKTNITNVNLSFSRIHLNHQISLVLTAYSITVFPGIYFHQQITEFRTVCV